MENGLSAIQALGYGNTGLTTGAVQTPAIAPTNTNMSTLSGSVFNMPSYGKDYSDDLMMPDYLKMNNYTGYSAANPAGSVFAQSAQQMTPQMGYQQTFGSQMPAPTQSNPYLQEELAQYYNQNTQDAQPKTSTGTGKKTGVIMGILAPVAAEVAKVVKGGKFNVKSTLLKAPVFALAGWAIGALIDGISNKPAQLKTA